jgi:hypothetical protein
MQENTGDSEENTLDHKMRLTTRGPPYSAFTWSFGPNKEKR